MIANGIANRSQVRFPCDSHPNRPSRPVPSRPFIPWLNCIAWPQVVSDSTGRCVVLSCNAERTIR
jgi:hypothetical protein